MRQVDHKIFGNKLEKMRQTPEFKNSNHSRRKNKSLAQTVWTRLYSEIYNIECFHCSTTSICYPYSPNTVNALLILHSWGIQGGYGTPYSRIQRQTHIYH